MAKLDFQVFKMAIDKQFKAMVANASDLYCTTVEKDAMWDRYLSAFPPGSNPIFRERTEHDCSCCRQFVRAIGNVVAIVDGRLVSLWDAEIAVPEYAAVAREMALLVKAAPIDNHFLSPVRKIGTDKNHEDADGKVITWDHFCVELPTRRNTGKDYFKTNKKIGPALSENRATHDVFLRGLTGNDELTHDALDSVLEIMASKSLYRGEEYLHAVQGFKALKTQFDKLPAAEQTLFAWANADKPGARVRNTAIGTLLIDLSKGTEFEDAVKKFETSIMAPANFKRPTALVTKSMVEAAQKKVEELELTSAFERRHARLSDITVNNILFVDRSVKRQLAGSPFDNIANKSTAPKDLSRVDSMDINNFLKHVLPAATSVEIMFENRHAGNLTSLIAPKHADAGRLFKWTNNFSWTYNGDVADSVRERVKKAGGNITGDLCCRLAWNNYDDLDFHLVEPSRNRIWYNSKISPSGGRLDVDANAGGGYVGRGTREPVENIFYANRRMLKPGNYELSVMQYRKMEVADPGFEVEIDYLGDVQRFSYVNPLRQNERVIVAKFTYSEAEGIKITHSLNATPVTRTLWGLKTNEFHPVNVLMHSPNHWDDQVGAGNKHYFFMLQGCINDGQARGIFNEFLRPELDKHRKVIEIVGSKTKVEPATDQLSGLGFSDTVRSEILVRVKGSVTRTLKVLI